MQVVPNISSNCSALIFRFKESIKIMLDPEHKGTMNLQNIRNYSHSDKCHKPEDLNLHNKFSTNPLTKNGKGIASVCPTEVHCC